MYNDKLKIIAGRSHPAFADAIAEHLDQPLTATDFVRFSNENLMVQIMENVRGADVFVIQTSSPPVNEGIIELLITIDALKGASAGRITAVIPYFPYARSDKKDRPRIAITARLMADLIQTAGADRVLTMDLHAAQIQGFFRIPVDHLEATPIICDYFRRKDLSNYVLVAADAGEAKELGRYANRLHLPMAIIDKRRHGDDEQAHAQHLIGDAEGLDALLIDDEIATGGTLIEAAKFLMKSGARSVHAAATHAVLSGPAVERFCNCPEISEIVVTDTVPSEHKKIPQITRLSVTQVFAEAIRRIHYGETVSALFR
jgi:ribose-phosphate pyrophosphokinase